MMTHRMRHPWLGKLGDWCDSAWQWTVTIVTILAGAALIAGVGTLVMLAVIDATARWTP